MTPFRRVDLPRHGGTDQHRQARDSTTHASRTSATWWAASPVLASGIGAAFFIVLYGLLAPSGLPRLRDGQRRLRQVQQQSAQLLLDNRELREEIALLGGTDEPGRQHLVTVIRKTLGYARADELVIVLRSSVTHEAGSDAP